MSDICDKLLSAREYDGVELLPPGAPVADLNTIHLGQLQAGNAEQSAKLFRACKEHGFFYLDLQHPDNNTFLKSIDNLFALSEEFFDLDIEEKLAYDVDKLSEMKVNGYVFGPSKPLLDSWFSAEYVQLQASRT